MRQPRILVAPCVILLAVAGCFTPSSPVVDPAPESASEDATAPPETVTWDLTAIEAYFTVDAPPRFDREANGFVITVTALEAGNCVLAPAVPSGFFGFEAILHDVDDREIHSARDAGSASATAPPAEAYGRRAPRRICVEPPRWSAGERIRLTIAPGVDHDVLSRVRHGKLSAI